MTGPVFLPRLEPLPGEPISDKTTYGGFAGSNLGEELGRLGVQSLVMGGIVTNVCLEATAREAVDRGFEVTLVEDGSAAYSPEVHQSHLLSFQALFGQVRTTSELMGSL